MAHCAVSFNTELMTFYLQRRSVSMVVAQVSLQAGDLMLHNRSVTPAIRSHDMDYLDLNSDPYGPMSGPRVAGVGGVSKSSQLVMSSHTLCGDTDLCGPLASHPYCATHCTARHITYQSNNSCFGSLQC